MSVAFLACGKPTLVDQNHLPNRLRPSRADGRKSRHAIQASEMRPGSGGSLAQGDTLGHKPSHILAEEAMSDTAPTPTATPAPAPVLPPLYSSLEPLTSQRHSGLRVREAGYAFAAGISAIPLAAEEFAVASRHYPIVFTAQAPHMPVAIVGLTADTNTHVGADGAWAPGKYVPAYLRRFPFFLVRVAEGSDELALCIDGRAAQFSTTEGEALFGADGKPTPMLDRAFAFCRGMEQAMQKTRALAESLTALNLLQPAAVQFEQNGKPMKIDGFHAIQKEAFAALPAEKLAELRDSGALEVIYAHLLSIGGLPELAAKMTASAAA